MPTPDYAVIGPAPLRSVSVGAPTAGGAPVETAPTVETSGSLDEGVLTIVAAAAGFPAPTVALAALTLGGVDVLASATGSGPWFYDVPPSAVERTVAWTVTATNAGGADSASASLVAPPDAAAPTAPAAISEWTAAGLASDGRQAAIYVLAAPADGGSPITGFEYRLDGGSAVSFGATALPLSALLSGLAFEAPVSVEVRAVNAIGAGPWSAPVDVTPAEARAQVALGAIQPRTGYPSAAYADGDFYGTQRAGTDSGFPSAMMELTGLTPETTYAIEIDDLRGVTLTDNDAVRIDAHPNAGTADTAWSGTTTVLASMLAVDLPARVSATYTTGAGETSFWLRWKISNAETGDVFYSTVSVYGPGAALAEAPPPPARTAPPAMDAPALAEDGGFIVATFAATETGGSPVTRYDLRWSANDGASWTEISGAVSPATITGVDLATRHLVEVRAVNAVGVGAWSPSAPIGGAVASLVAPTVAYPDWTIGSTTTISVADGRVALQNAIAAGGTIQLEAGVYDLTGWVTRGLVNPVRITGAGKGQTILRCDFDPATHFSTGPVAVFGVVQGRVVIEDLTFENWRAGLISSGYYPTAQFPDGAIISSVRNAATTPLVWGDLVADTGGLAMKNVAFDRCGRAVHLEEHTSNLFTNRFNNIHVHHVDVTRGWIGFALVSKGGGSEWMFYDCRLHDNCIPNAATGANWGTVSPGIIGANNHDTPGQGAPGRNVFVEHCTFSALGCLETATNAVPRFAPIRLTGVQHVRVRRCRFENIGYAPDGVTLRNTLPSEFESLGYLKCDDVLFEDCILENTCAGGEAAHGAKGSISNDPGTSTYHVRNLYWRKHRPVPATHAVAVNTNQLKLIGGNWYTRGIFGTSHVNDAVWENVWIEDVDTLYGFVGRLYDYGWMATNLVRDVTLKDVRVHNADGLDSPFVVGSDFTSSVGVIVENLRIEGFAPLGANPAAVHSFNWDGVDNIGSITVRDVSFAVTGSVTSAALLSHNVAGAVAVTPTGEILGAVGTRNAKTGANTATTTLAAYGGSVTGASLDWMGANVIGCAARA